VFTLPHLKYLTLIGSFEDGIIPPRSYDNINHASDYYSSLYEQNIPLEEETGIITSDIGYQSEEDNEEDRYATGGRFDFLEGYNAMLDDSTITTLSDMSNLEFNELNETEFQHYQKVGSPYYVNIHDNRNLVTRRSTRSSKRKRPTRRQDDYVDHEIIQPSHVDVTGLQTGDVRIFECDSGMIPVQTTLEREAQNSSVNQLSELKTNYQRCEGGQWEGNAPTCVEEPLIDDTLDYKGRGRN